MKTFYKSYIQAFHKYANYCLESKVIKTITRYAILINLKANQLIARAKLNGMKDVYKLEKEIFEAGKVYVKKYMARLHHERKNKVTKKDPP